MQALSLDRTALLKHPETAAEIAKQDAYLSALVNDLAEDEKRFRELAEITLSNARAESEDPLVYSDGGFEQISAAYQQTLGKWLLARNHLTDEHLDLVIENAGKGPELQRLEAMLRVLKRIGTIRRIHGALEIIAPAMFAIFAVLYVRFG